MDHVKFTAMQDGDREVTGVNMIDSIEAAVRASIERSGDRAIAVIPEGPYVVPFHDPQSVAA